MTPGQAYKALAAFFGILAAAAAGVFLRMRWSGGGDFDVTGFLWLVSNAGRLTVLVVFVFCLGAAILYWLRSWRVG